MSKIKAGFSSEKLEDLSELGKSVDRIYYQLSSDCEQGGKVR